MDTSLAGPHVEVNADREPVAIWSGEHRAWWGPNKAGYYTDPNSAGRYTFKEACYATHHVGPEKRIRIENAPPLRGAAADMVRDLVTALEALCEVVDAAQWGKPWLGRPHAQMDAARAAIKAARGEA